MRIHVISDLHMRNVADFARAPASVDADVVVLAGDICDSPVQAMEWARTHFPMPVVVVAGNHEFHGNGLLAEIRKARAASDERVAFLEDDMVVIGGTRFLGSTLWTDFRLHGDDQVRASMHAAREHLPDFQTILLDDSVDGRMAPRFTTAASAERHARSRDFLAAMLAEPHDGPTVVVTHHASHPMSISPVFEGHAATPSFVSDLSDVILDGQPELWIHGHTHTSFDYRVGDTHVVCNPGGIGFRNTHFQPGKTVVVRQRRDLMVTIAELVAGTITWKAAKRDLSIVDESAIRRDLVGVLPWTSICERWGVPVEAVAAVWALTRPQPPIWPEKLPPAFEERMGRALRMLGALDAEPIVDEIERDDPWTEAKP